MKTNNKDKMIEEFWTALRNHTMWRDSANGLIEDRITELLAEALTKHEETVVEKNQKEAYKAFWWIKENHEWALINLDISLMLIDPDTDTIVDNSNKNTKHQYWLETGPFTDIDEMQFIPSHDYRLDCGGDTFEEAIINIAKEVKRHYGDKTNMYGKNIEEALQAIE